MNPVDPQKAAKAKAFLQERLGQFPGFYISHVPSGLAVYSSAFSLRDGDRSGARLVLDGKMRVGGDAWWLAGWASPSAAQLIAAAGARYDATRCEMFIDLARLEDAPAAILRMMMLRQALDGLWRAEMAG